VRRLRDRLDAAGTSLEDWAVVVRCDGEARGPAARRDASVPWLRVARRLDS
jgi:tRNA nucleotidyltransferase (CCA-adding enzyme)